MLLPIFALAALTVFAQLARERCRVWHDSVPLWSDALEKNRAEPLIRAKLAEAYLERRDFARAAAAAENAVEENAADAELLNNYAAALDGGGKPEAARTVLEKASVLYSGHAGLNYNLGVLYARAGLFAHAQASFAKALELDQNFPGARAALERLNNTGAPKPAAPAASRKTGLSR